MKACPSCEQQNPEEAKYCLQCGKSIPESESQAPPESFQTPPESLSGEQELWQTFIGPSKSLQFTIKDGWSWRPAYLYYREKFRLFQTPTGPRFSLSWHWPAALFDPFLWFLYRKMYMYALVYAVGPVVSALLTGDLTIGIVWRIFAGASANYIYYWHVKDHLSNIGKSPALDTMARARLVADEGGIQPYVLWLGAALHLFMVGLILAAVGQGPTGGELGDPGDQNPVQKFF